MRPKLLTDWTRVDEADDIGTHAQPIVVSKFELPDSGGDTAVTKNVVVCCLDDRDFFYA